jgi:hypothetical protein
MRCSRRKKGEKSSLPPHYCFLPISVYSSHRVRTPKPALDPQEEPSDRAAEREKWMHPVNSANPLFEAKEWLLDHIETLRHIAWLMPKLRRRLVREMSRKKAR